MSTNDASNFEPVIKPYQIPYFSGPKSAEEFATEAREATSPRTLYFDKKFERSREILVFLEETKIWEELLQDCINRAGVNASKACGQLHDIVAERNAYFKANFNAALQPKLSPGLPSVYERHVTLA